MSEVRVHRGMHGIPAVAWDALHDGCNPFVSHAFLSGLEATGCLRPDWGWTPCHVGVWDGGTLVAAAPGYLKDNSHGEFVFDHAWAHAYAAHGQAYFPKWLGAVPYSPVTGPRLLARDDAGQRALLDAIADIADGASLSSAHINFHDAADEAAFMAADAATGAGRWLLREDIQFHWRNDAGWRDFDDFLVAMDHRHRKNIRQERRKVREAGIDFRIVHGDEAGDAELAAMHGFYLQTFADYGNAPALTLEFLHHLARAMPRQLVIVLAYRGDRAVAGALCLRGADTLFGRYWGASHEPGGDRHGGLHFEACYYKGIEYCLREGLTRFEPGAQGVHKIARGFLPAIVRSRHRIAEPRLAAALADWCTRERRQVRQHLLDLRQRSPFRAATAP